MTASVLAVGVVLPEINAISGQPMLGRDALAGVAMVVLGFTALTALAAAALRGMARLLEQDQVQQRGE